MSQYSIRELEELSGVKAHTIRIWEKRYRIVTPTRTSTNIRQYSDDDLKKLINVALLNKHGLKISRIATLSVAELANRVTELGRNKNEPVLHVDRLVNAMVDLDEEKFESILSEIIDGFGFESAIIEVCYPFLEKIGVLWQTGNISPLQEHFISNLLRQKILVAIDGLPSAPRRAPKVVLFLPEEELHELGLLFNHYLARKSGFKTYYLGQRVPLNDVRWFCKHQEPLALITSITSAPATPFVEHYLHDLCAINPSISVVASGHKLSRIALQIPKNLFLVTDTHHFKAVLDSLRKA